MIEIKLTGHTVGELRALIIDLAHMMEQLSPTTTGPANPEPASPDASKTTKKKTTKKTTKKKAASKSQPSKEEGKEEPKQEETSGVGQEQVLAALQKVNTDKGLAKAKEILNQFNSNRMSEIDPSQFGNFVAACEKALVE